MRRERRHVLVALAAAALLPAACGSPSPPPPRTADDYGERPKLRFDVAAIDLEEAYRPPPDPNHVEHLMPDPPAWTALRWAKARLVAAGPAGRLRFIVREASVARTPLATTPGVGGWFTVEPAERYDARVMIEAVIVDDRGSIEATANVGAERSISVAENATQSERDDALFALSEKLMADLDAQLEQTFSRVFFRYLLT